MAETPKARWPALVLFDLDGTLIDSAPDIAAATNELLKRHAHAPLTLDDVRSMIGNGVKKLVERAFEKRGAKLDNGALSDRTNEMMEIYAANLTGLTVRMQGADQLLKNLAAKECKLALVTNKPEVFSRRILVHFGWDDIFHAVVGGDSCLTRKPDPEMLLYACKQTGCDTGATIMVGDSSADISSARNAGIKSIAVRGGYTNIAVDDLGADAVANRLCDVMEAMAQLQLEH